MTRTKRATFVAVVFALAGSVVFAQDRGRGVVPQRNAARPSGPNLGGRPYPIRTDVPTPTGLVAPAAAYTGITPGALKPLNNNRGGGRGGFVGYPGFVGAPFLPYLGTAPTSSFPSFSEQAEEISARQEALRQDAMAQQMEQMNSELRQLRENQMSFAPQFQQPAQPVMPAAAIPAEPPTPATPITVVLQNGTRLSMSNFAVMNGVLWDFSKQPARKVPVSSINVAASKAASEENGADFPNLPSSAGH